VAIDLGPLAGEVRPGDSVTVNGACLTAAELEPPIARFDVVDETLRATTLGSLRRGAKVNLETALRLGESLDGHLVQGHIDGLAQVKTLAQGPQKLVAFAADPDLTETMVAKGSVAVDGVSLTLVTVDPGGFSVALIPTTLTATTLGDLAVGRRVNVETDLIGKYVRRYLRQLADGGQTGLTIKKLMEAGFA